MKQLFFYGTLILAALAMSGCNTEGGGTDITSNNEVKRFIEANEVPYGIYYCNMDDQSGELATTGVVAMDLNAQGGEVINLWYKNQAQNEYLTFKLRQVATENMGIDDVTDIFIKASKIYSVGETEAMSIGFYFDNYKFFGHVSVDTHKIKNGKVKYPPYKQKKLVDLTNCIQL